jgi:hypothetical protein
MDGDGGEGNPRVKIRAVTAGGESDFDRSDRIQMPAGVWSRPDNVEMIRSTSASVSEG